jgi:sulfide dehydrogenase cytochrome subunit
MTGKALVVVVFVALARGAWAEAPLAAEGCLPCHGPRGAGVPTGGMPAIAGQDARRLEEALLAFRRGERAGTIIMDRIARGYTEAEIAAMAAYFSAQRQ